MEINLNAKIIVCFEQPHILKQASLFHLTNQFITDEQTVQHYINQHVHSDYSNNKLEIALKMLSLSSTILSRQINHLNSFDQLLVKFVTMLLSKKKTVYLNNYLINFDQYYQSKIVRLLKKLARQQSMTIYISDVEYNLLYQIGDLFYYPNLGYLTKQMVLKNIDNINSIYHPDSIKFIKYINQKYNLNINYQVEVKELLKSLYRKH